MGRVPFHGVGWIPFLTTPDYPDVPQDQVPKPQTEPQPQVRQPSQMPHQRDDLITPVQINDKKTEAPLFALPGWVIVLGLSILIPATIVFGPMLVVAAIKRRPCDRRGVRPRMAQSPARGTSSWIG